MGAISTFKRTARSSNFASDSLVYLNTGMVLP